MTTSFERLLWRLVLDVLLNWDLDPIQNKDLTSIGNPTVELRQSQDSPKKGSILIRWHPYIESAPGSTIKSTEWLLHVLTLTQLLLTDIKINHAKTNVWDMVNTLQKMLTTKLFWDIHHIPVTNPIFLKLHWIPENRLYMDRDSTKGKIVWYVPQRCSK